MVSAAYALQLPPGTAEAELAAATLASLPPTFSQPEWGLQRAFSREGSEGSEGSEGESKRDARSFVASCMQAEPDMRPSAAHALTHPWVALDGAIATLRLAMGLDLAARDQPPFWPVWPAHEPLRKAGRAAC